LKSDLITRKAVDLGLTVRTEAEIYCSK